MRKLIIILLLCTAGLSSMFAQSSMTEKQIIEYVKKQHEDGKTNEEIEKELLKKGVKPEQLKRIKEKYERQGKNGAVDLTEKTTEATRKEDRLRNKSGVEQRSQTADDIEVELEDFEFEPEEELDQEEVATEPAGPKRLIFALAMCFLVAVCETMYIFRKSILDAM